MSDPGRRAAAEAALRAAEAATQGRPPDADHQEPGEPQESRKAPPADAAAGGDDPVAKALAFVLRSTRQRPQSEAEVAKKLRDREWGADVIDAALARARDLGAVDDGALARAWVEDRGRRRGFGAARLREELRRRGISDADVDAALASLADRDDHSVAVDLARRRHRQLPGGLDTTTVVRRLAGYLVRRGHPRGLAERAAREAVGLIEERD